jgi:hypothetical protein
LKTQTAAIATNELEKGSHDCLQFLRRRVFVPLNLERLFVPADAVPGVTHVVFRILRRSI